MYIHKEGITLRKLERKDLPLLKELKNESWFGTHNITFLNDLDQERWFEGLNHRTHLILIAEGEVDSTNHTEIGLQKVVARKNKKTVPIGLYKIQNNDWFNRTYDSSHDVFKHHRGKGWSKPVLVAGTDFAFEVLNMNRIDGQVLENNVASRKSAVYAGFQEEGIRRKSIHKCGEWLDSIHIGILREDWEQLERVKKHGGICNESYKPLDDK